MKHLIVLLLALLAAVNGLCSIDTTTASNQGSATVVSGEYLGQSFRVPSMIGTAFGAGTLDKIYLTLGSITGSVSITVDVHPIPMAGSGIYATGTATFCNGCANTIVFSPPMPIKGCQEYAFLITTPSTVPVPFKYVSNVYADGEPYYGTSFPPSPFMASNDLSFTLYFSNCAGTACPINSTTTSTSTSISTSTSTSTTGAPLSCVFICGYGGGVASSTSYPTLWNPNDYIGVVSYSTNFDRSITFGWIRDFFLNAQYSGIISFTFSIYEYPLPANENNYLYRATVTSSGYPTGIYHLISNCFEINPCIEYAFVLKDLHSANPVYFYTDNPAVDNYPLQSRLEGSSWPPTTVAGDLIWGTSWMGCPGNNDPLRC